MCSCSPSVAHVYNHDFSLIHNIIGESLMSEFRIASSLKEQVLFSLESCCSNSYLTSFLSLGWTCLLAIAITFVAGMIFNRNRKIAAVLASLWSLVTGWSLYAEYAQASQWASKHSNRYAQHLADLLDAVPIQFAFNAIVAFVIAGAGYLMTRPAKVRPDHQVPNC